MQGVLQGRVENVSGQAQAACMQQRWACPASRSLQASAPCSAAPCAGWQRALQSWRAAGSRHQLGRLCALHWVPACRPAAQQLRQGLMHWRLPGICSCDSCPALKQRGLSSSDLSTWAAEQSCNCTGVHDGCRFVQASWPCQPRGADQQASCCAQGLCGRLLRAGPTWGVFSSCTRRRLASGRGPAPGMRSAPSPCAAAAGATCTAGLGTGVLGWLPAVRRSACAGPWRGLACVHACAQRSCTWAVLHVSSTWAGRATCVPAWQCSTRRQGCRQGCGALPAQCRADGWGCQAWRARGPTTCV